MADTVSSQTILNGPRNLVMKFTSVSDGSGETSVLKVDVSAIGANAVRIVRIDYFMSGMGLDILWDADVNVVAFTIPQDETGSFDGKLFGGIPNDAGTGKTGDVLFTTVGQAVDDRYTIILHMVKK